MTGNGIASAIATRVFHTNSQKRPSAEQKTLEDLAKDAAVAPYVEEDPSVREWLWSLRPSRKATVRYLASLFPFILWIPRYNWHWMLWDMIAGRPSYMTPKLVISDLLQALLSALSLFPRQWHMRCLQI